MQRLEVSGAVRPVYGSLGVKGLNLVFRFANVYKTLRKDRGVLKTFIFSLLWRFDPISGHSLP